MELLLKKISEKQTLANFAAAGLWGIYFLNTGRNFLESGLSIYLLLLLRNSLIISLFLIRREAKDISQNIVHWVVAGATTIFAFFYVPKGSYALVPEFVSNVLFIMGAAISCYAILNLGKSLGIVPANRGVVTHELYGWVRHPIYTSYMMMDIAILLAAFSILNAAIFSTLFVLLFIRARFEEGLLMNDPSYRQYCKRVKFRFIPGLI